MTGRERKTLHHRGTAKLQLRFSSRRNLGMASAFSKWSCIPGTEQIGTNQGEQHDRSCPRNTGSMSMNWKDFAAKVGASGGITNAFPTWQGQGHVDNQGNLSLVPCPS